MKVNVNRFGFIRCRLTAVLLVFSFSVSAQNIENYFTQEELKNANTACKATYMSVTERAVIKVLNLARMYPRKFLKYFYVYAAGEGMNAQKIRGNYYYNGLEKTLKTMKPVSPLYPSKEMYSMALCWAQEAGNSGTTGHDRKKCTEGYFAECCTYGRDNAVDMVMSFLIDENVSSLGHRTICFDNSYSLLGVSAQPHTVWRINAVLDFTYGKTTTLSKSKKAMVYKRQHKTSKGAYRRKKV